MSQLIIKTVQLTNVRPHPDAERLDIADAGGWQVVVSKGRYKNGDKVVFIPPDAVIPKDLHESWGVTNYLAELPEGSPYPEGSRRVKAARLRGQASYGLIVNIPNFISFEESAEFFEDIQGHWDIQKWEPPAKILSGDMIEDHPLFHKYTSIESYQNFPDVIADGEMIILTEKINGTNCRVGIIPLDGQPVLMAGSHNCVRQQTDDKGNPSVYWLPLLAPQYVNLQVMIQALWKQYKAPVIIFGELYGAGISDMNYGQQATKGFRVFDISINGNYLSYQDKKSLLKQWGVEMVPILYRGPMSKAVVQKYTDGPSKVGENTNKFKGREGVVITPEVERHDPSIGRVILKSVSADYFDRKGAVDTK